MTDHANARTAALKLLQSGDVTISEAAELAGVSRQAVRKWVLQAEIDIAEARRHRLQALWAAAFRKR